MGNKESEGIIGYGWIKEKGIPAYLRKRWREEIS